MKKLLFAITTSIVLITIMVSRSSVSAFESAKPTDYIIWAGGKYAFVMLAPGTSDFEEHDQDLRSKVSQSGLYLSSAGSYGYYLESESYDPLWTVDWYEYKLNVDVLPDGEHIIRWPGPAWTEDCTILEFYENGEGTRSYTLRDLVAHPEQIPKSADDIFEWKQGASFDDQQLWLQITSGDEYIFDIASGEIIKELHPVSTPEEDPPDRNGMLARTSPFVKASLLAVVIVLIAAAGVILFRVSRNNVRGAQ